MNRRLLIFETQCSLKLATCVGRKYSRQSKLHFLPIRHKYLAAIPRRIVYMFNSLTHLQGTHLSCFASLRSGQDTTVFLGSKKASSQHTFALVIHETMVKAKFKFTSDTLSKQILCYVSFKENSMKSPDFRRSLVIRKTAAGN